jgi:hypothetical protein
MEVDFGRLKRPRYSESSVNIEGERERSSRVAGNWPPEQEDYPYNYIPGQYAYMGSKRRELKKQ